MRQLSFLEYRFLLNSMALVCLAAATTVETTMRCCGLTARDVANIIIMEVILCRFSATEGGGWYPLQNPSVVQICSATRQFSN
jgi:hypothetical protein